MKILSNGHRLQHLIETATLTGIEGQNVTYYMDGQLVSQYYAE
ncbi:hypothetical protein OK016_24525 [Vibrio chagasii]|nr:hypothetical protein [Vibrio chagasii]